MKNLKKLLFKISMVFLIFGFISCEKQNLESENLSLSKNDITKRIEKFDEYTIEKPEKDGIHLVAKNERTGSTLFIRTQRARVVGFQILKRDQHLVVFDKLVIPSAGNLPPWTPDCPDGWDEKLICYINKDGIAVSYTRCTPTSFTIGLEPEW